MRATLTIFVVTQALLSEAQEYNDYPYPEGVPKPPKNICNLPENLGYSGTSELRTISFTYLLSFIWEKKSNYFTFRIRKTYCWLWHTWLLQGATMQYLFLGRKPSYGKFILSYLCFINLEGILVWLLFFYRYVAL